MENKEINLRFTYHAPKGNQSSKYESIRGMAKSFAHYLNENCPDSRELSLAVTALEEVVMWANAAIARREE